MNDKAFPPMTALAVRQESLSSCPCPATSGLFWLDIHIYDIAVCQFLCLRHTSPLVICGTDIRRDAWHHLRQMSSASLHSSGLVMPCPPVSFMLKAVPGAIKAS
ncbi:hypothetical protein I6E46_05785 [Prevotella loescheii]|nr:hypothetical protein [Hoylesella loescheii]